MYSTDIIMCWCFIMLIPYDITLLSIITSSNHIILIPYVDIVAHVAYIIWIPYHTDMISYRYQLPDIRSQCYHIVSLYWNCTLYWYHIILISYRITLISQLIIITCIFCGEDMIKDMECHIWQHSTYMSWVGRIITWQSQLTPVFSSLVQNQIW